jgi:hypothetical protein
MNEYYNSLLNDLAILSIVPKTYTTQLDVTHVFIYLFTKWQILIVTLSGFFIKNKNSNLSKYF